MYPREVCLGSPLIAWGFVVCNLIIFLSYMLIPYTIWRIHREVGPEMPEPYLLRVVKAFIIACGLTHFSGAAVIFLLVFRFELVALLIAAPVSAFAAVLLAVHAPRITSGLRSYIDFVHAIDQRETAVTR